jgi:DNA-binding CsgD family transcriptional regulator
MFYSVIAPTATRAAVAYAHYIDLLESAGSDGFATVVGKALHEYRVDEFAAFFHRDGEEAPQLVVSGGVNVGATTRAASFRTRFYRFDDLDRLLSNADAQPLMIARVCADDVDSRDYRRVFFLEPGFAEKLLILHKMPDGWLTLGLYRRETGRFDETEKEALHELAQIVMPIIATHSRLFGIARERPLSVADIETRIGAAFPSLSPREREVCARTLVGITAEGIGIDLGIKQTTVLTYRRRAYERLNISTVHQLSATLIR